MREKLRIINILVTKIEVDACQDNDNVGGVLCEVSPAGVTAACEPACSTAAPCVSVYILMIILKHNKMKVTHYTLYSILLSCTCVLPVWPSCSM